jgi:hypothetical protein
MDLTRFAQSALQLTDAIVYCIEGEYKMTSPKTATPVSLGRSISEAARTLLSEQRRMQQLCSHLFSVRVNPETPDGKRFRCPNCGKETRNMQGVILTRPVSSAAHA